MKYKVKKPFVITSGRMLVTGDYYLVDTVGKFSNGLLNNGFIEPLPEIDTAGWEKNGIVSKLANIIVAPEDYTEGDKKHFTYDEALEIEKKLPDGWRLPTRSEWVLLCEEFGQRGEKLDTEELTKKPKAQCRRLL